MLGNTASFLVSSATRYASQAISLLDRSGNEDGAEVSAGGRAISPLNAVGAGAVGNILAIVANMRSSESASDTQGGVSDANLATAISAYLAQNDNTVEDAHAILGQSMDALMAKAPDSHRSMAEAYRNGTLEIQRVGDMGVESSQKVTLQFDEDGRQVGTAVEYYGSEKALDFLNSKMGQPDGTLGVWGTDKDTGKNATWMAIGNDYFYVTW